MDLSSARPVGIFDSGVGGLTVAAAVKQMLPNETLIYFGDTAHLPYGDKSSDSVRYYSGKIADLLLTMDVKVILIACNTASAAAYADMKEHVGDKAIVINVIDPTVEYIVRSGKEGKVGVIGTKGTINSGTYEKKLREARPGIDVVSLATPLLVPMIEEGFIFDDISNAIIRTYLSHDSLRDIESLILGCTHYPIIKNQIRKFYDFKVDIIDSGQVVARYLRDRLQEKNLLCPSRKIAHRFFVSDHTNYFERIAKLFFEEEIHLELKDIWR
jgi:glutamate racemase